MKVEVKGTGTIEDGDPLPEGTVIDKARLDLDTGTAELIGRFPELVALCKAAHEMMSEAGASNYLQFDIEPRLTLDMPPIRITFQKVDGESPGVQNRRLRDELAALKAKYEPAPEPPKIGTYCYAWHEEAGFYGDFETEAEAIAAAIKEADQDVMFVGETQHPREGLDENRIGEDIADMVRERLEDVAGEAAENFETTFEQHTEIGKQVLDYIEREIGFKCYGVKNIRKVAVPPLDEASAMHE